MTKSNMTVGKENTKIIKITLANQTIVDLVISGNQKLVDSVEPSYFKINELLTDIVLNGLKLKMQTLFRDEKEHFANIKKIIN